MFSIGIPIRLSGWFYPRRFLILFIIIRSTLTFSGCHSGQVTYILLSNKNHKLIKKTMFLFSNANTVTFEIRISLEHFNKLLQHRFLAAKCVFVDKKRNQYCISFYGLWSIQIQQVLSL